MIDLKLLKTLANNFVVLYVEDDLLIQEEMQSYLSKFFQEVLVANDGEEGLSLYKTREFHLVITDLSMPKMNGIEMLEEIRKINGDQAILITTAHSESDYIIRAIKIGVDGYIIKPFDYEQLNYELFKIVEKLTKFTENEEYKKHLKRMVEQKTAELNSMISFQKYNYDKTLLSMVEMIEERDTYTAGHSQRVAHYSKLIAKKLEYEKGECTKIYQAGILHDIGKIVTPDAVLLKPNTLNSLEYKLIQEHPSVGYRLLKNIPMFEDLAEIVYEHHERYNGSGYPRGLKDNQIDKLAKIMTVADTFDAMTTNRIYKERKTKEEAFAELISLKSILFHPDVVDAAVIAFQDVVIDANIDQLPHTEVEKERFAYFYNDILTNLYNQNYLEFVLARNNQDFHYEILHILSLKNFSYYNTEEGWKNGDEILKQISNILKKCLNNSKAFRIFGDDFVLLENGTCDISMIKKEVDKILHKTRIDCLLQTVKLKDEKILTLSDIEKKYRV